MNKDTLTINEADKILYLAYKDVIKLLGYDTFIRLASKVQLMTQREFFTHIAEMIRNVPVQMQNLENEISADYQKQIAELKKEIESLKANNTKETPRVPKLGDTVWIFHFTFKKWIETKVVEIKPGYGYYDFGSKDDLGRIYYRNLDETGTLWAWEKPEEAPKTENKIEKKPDPGAGYRLLEEGEEIKENDEALYSWGWDCTGCVGYKVGDRGTLKYYRRKVEKKVNPKWPNPGVGYRLLKKGEIVQSTDQAWWTSTQSWHPTIAAGEAAVENGYDYRRKVEEKKQPEFPNPGPGYRLLEEGEILEKSDERWSCIFNQWVPTNYPGEPVGGKNTNASTYRRKIVTTKNGISCGSGYRMLDKDEILKADDEYWSVIYQKWGRTNLPGEPIGVGDNYVYRRKI